MQSQYLLRNKYLINIWNVGVNQYFFTITFYGVEIKGVEGSELILSVAFLGI